MDGEPPEGEAPIGEGEAGTDGEVARNEMENAAGTGEAPVDVGESLLEMTGESQLKSDCEGNCFSCICAPGFTGNVCSEEIELECSVRNCSRCDTNQSICDECDPGLDLSDNECKCPVAGCSVCDTGLTSCDLCSDEGAEFDDQSLQCVTRDRQDTTANTDDEFDFYLAILVIILVFVPVMVFLCCVCCIFAISVKRKRNKQSEVYFGNEQQTTAVNINQTETTFGLQGSQPAINEY